jgi:hypothetical protein
MFLNAEGRGDCQILLMVYSVPQQIRKRYTNSINDCNTSLGEDAIHRVSTDKPMTYYPLTHDFHYSF